MRPQFFYNFLKINHLQFACAESCTGGGLGSLITSMPGSSDLFWGGVISYSNEAKIKYLGVRNSTLRSRGAVSSLTALEMAWGLKNSSGVPINISITGIAGPGGGTQEKPVGTVWFGVAGSFESKAVGFCFKGSRATIRKTAIKKAMDIAWLWWTTKGMLDSSRLLADNVGISYSDPADLFFKEIN